MDGDGAGVGTMIARRSSVSMDRATFHAETEGVLNVMELEEKMIMIRHSLLSMSLHSNGTFIPANGRRQVIESSSYPADLIGEDSSPPPTA